MENETEQRLSPLHPDWAERHADECTHILISALGAISHAHSEKELVEDSLRVTMRAASSYLTIRAYRKIDFSTLGPVPESGSWVAVRGLNQTALVADRVASVLEWFPIFSKSQSPQKLRLYEEIDIRPQIKSILDERDRKAAAEAKRKAEKQKAEQVAKVLRFVRGGNETVEDLIDNTGIGRTSVERIVKELIDQGKLEMVDYQPPVQKLLKVKQ